MGEDSATCILKNDRGCHAVSSIAVPKHAWESGYMHKSIQYIYVDGTILFPMLGTLAESYSLVSRHPAVTPTQDWKDQLVKI